ncbi:N-acyl homoserine lactonase family protein [Rubrobacter taiwanensis]|jgi:N-acyl homoserine lactone hydrolase|uniref:N-acyl homoserine lactonase family protein n=1 Tax=Rubrobacter taiwanensis TaxID=185139 RepID=A0A4R1BQ92_9ACTN|nr:N-acyl homoserine lactonase family protein [Rubrobacter taiwanensis]TCJ19840.1 N-acyl homoserine lactonase family protein [Rubrobacter taiwanensis]
MSDLRLYFLECGSLKTQVQFIKMNQGLGEPYEIPVPFFLITHPRGNVLYDGGNALEVAQDAVGHWGQGVVDAYTPVMSEDQFVVNQLQGLDVDPASVRYVIQSHLHLDHTGAIGHFPNAQYIVQRRELQYAYTPDWFQKPAYIRPDFDRDVDWLLLDGRHDDEYDVFGDGTIKTLFTPGHAPGHMSVVVNLENTGAMVLTADACYTLDHYENQALPGLIHSAADVAESVSRIRRTVERLEAQVVTGHDPEAWPGFKKAPEYYD